MKPKIESDVWLSVVTDVFWQKREQTKTTPNKTFQTKTLRTKTNLPVKTYVCMHVLLKIRGFRDVWRTLGGPEMCDTVWQGEGVKIGPK